MKYHIFYNCVSDVDIQLAVVLCCSASILRNVGLAGIVLARCEVVYFVPRV